MRRLAIACLLALAAAPGLAPAQTPAAAPAALHLVCTGFGLFTDADGRLVPAPGQALVELTGPAAGRIRLADALTPLFHSDTDNGWRTIDGLASTETQITGYQVGQATPTVKLSALGKSLSPGYTVTNAEPKLHTPPGSQRSPARSAGRARGSSSRTVSAHGDPAHRTEDPPRRT